MFYLRKKPRGFRTPNFKTQATWWTDLATHYTMHIQHPEPENSAERDALQVLKLHVVIFKGLLYVLVNVSSN